MPGDACGNAGARRPFGFCQLGTLSAFAIVCGGVVVLRVTSPEARRPFRAPALLLFGTLGTAGCLYLLSNLSLPTWLRFVVRFLVGIGIYAFYGYRKSRLRGASV